METHMVRTPTPAWGVLLTSRKTLLYEVREWHGNLYAQLKDLILLGSRDSSYTARLVQFALEMELISRFFYLGKNGEYKKLTPEEYAQELFWYYFDNDETGFQMSEHFPVKQDPVVFRIYQIISDIVCHMVSAVTHVVDKHRFAYYVDYVITQKGDVPEPEYYQDGSVKNYPLRNRSRNVLPRERLNLTERNW